jgi:hypothetical protein
MLTAGVLIDSFSLLRPQAWMLPADSEDELIQCLGRDTSGLSGILRKHMPAAKMAGKNPASS